MGCFFYPSAAPSELKEFAFNLKFSLIVHLLYGNPQQLKKTSLITSIDTYFFFIWFTKVWRRLCLLKREKICPRSNSLSTTLSTPLSIRLRGNLPNPIPHPIPIAIAAKQKQFRTPFFHSLPQSRLVDQISPNAVYNVWKKSIWDIFETGY